MARLFDPDHIDQTLADLTNATTADARSDPAPNSHTGASLKPTVDDIDALIAEIHETFGDMRAALEQAQGPDKAALLTSLGVAVTFDPVTRIARVTCTLKGW